MLVALVAMILQVLTLMPMRTIMNYQVRARVSLITPVRYVEGDPLYSTALERALPKLAKPCTPTVDTDDTTKV